MEICRELLEQVRRSLSLDPHPTVEARRSALVCGCFKGDTRRCALVFLLLQKIVVRIKWVTHHTYLKITKHLRVRSV